MKAWYDDIDAATLQRIKTYSAFNDATSKNLMMQTMYEYREKEIQDFKETNHELAETCIARKKQIAELEEKISILLSCKNCPENKGGYICQKEYEDKCLTQKIQYIKELQIEIAELENNNNVYCEGEGETLVVNVSFDKFTRINANHKMYYPRNEELEKELSHEQAEYDKMFWKKNEIITRAKDLLSKWVELFGPKNKDILPTPIQIDTEKFLKEIE